MTKRVVAAAARDLASSVRRGVGLDRFLPRRLLRPVFGRETPIWRWIHSPRLRLACFRDPIDCLIHALLASRRSVRFIQIGANDGVMNDPLWTFRRYANWSGVLVEPQDAPFRRLSLNYAPWKRRLIPVRAAVGAVSGRQQFHHFAESAEAGSGLDQLASLERGHLERYASRSGKSAPDIIATAVECVTLRDLMQAHGIDAPDLVHIDTEGADEAIVRQVDVAGAAPALLIYEHIHLDVRARARLRSWLEEADYETLEIGADTVAVSAGALVRMRTLRTAWRLVKRTAPQSSGTLR